MIKTEYGYRYSPEPQEAYVREGLGHGMLPATLAQWNLCWLSFPTLDKYLETDASSQHLMAELTPTLFGTVSGSALNEKIFPGISSTLLLHPRDFLARTADGPWEDLPAYALLGEHWVTTIRRRAKLAAETERAATLTRDVLARVQDNVIYGRFGKKT